MLTLQHFQTLPLLPELNRELRARTVLFALNRGNEKHYVPWMSIAPITSSLFLQRELLSPCQSRGALVIDRPYLEAVTRFLEGMGKPIITTSGFRDPEATIKIFVDISERMPTAPKLFQDALDLLKHAESINLLYEMLVDFVIPLDRNSITQLSTHFARGAVFVGMFPELHFIDLTLGLAHETAHQSLHIFESTDLLIASSPDKLVYSGIRDTERPAIQALHAAGALAFMLWFCQVVAHSVSSTPVVTELKARSLSIKNSLHKTLAALQATCTFTPLGRALMTDLVMVAEQ